MENTENRAPGKRELVLAAGILLTALLLLLINKFLHNDPAVFVEISIDGIPVETLDLKNDQEYTIKNDGGGTNILIIKNGEAWVTEASCPDKICIHQGKISRDGEMIVCLPNRMIVKISGGQ